MNSAEFPNLPHEESPQPSPSLESQTESLEAIARIQEAFDPYIKQQEEDGHYHEEDYDPEREYQEIVGRLRELLLSREPSPKPARDFLGFTKQVIRDESVPLPDHLKEVAYTYFYFQKAQREAAPYISAKFATDEYCEFVRSAYLAALEQIPTLRTLVPDGVISHLLILTLKFLDTQEPGWAGQPDLYGADTLKGTLEELQDGESYPQAAATLEGIKKTIDTLEETYQQKFQQKEKYYCSVLLERLRNLLVQIEKVTQSKGNSPYVELGNMAYWPTEGGIKGILAFDAQNTQFVKIPVREKRTFIGMKTKEMLYDEAQAYPADLYLIYKVGREALTFLGKDQAEQVRSTVKLVSQSS